MFTCPVFWDIGTSHAKETKILCFFFFFFFLLLLLLLFMFLLREIFCWRKNVNSADRMQPTSVHAQADLQSCYISSTMYIFIYIYGM